MLHLTSCRRVTQITYAEHSDLARKIEDGSLTITEGVVVCSACGGRRATDDMDWARKQAIVAALRAFGA